MILNVSALKHKAIALDRGITLATTPWEPFYGPEMKNHGYFFEITREAFKRAGYNCNIKYVPWKRALEMAKRGKYDGVVGVFYTNERADFFEYSLPISECRMVFWTKKERNIKYKSLKDLKPFKIGYNYGYFYNNEFKAATYLTKMKAYTTKENINLLLKDKRDIIIASEKVVYYLLQKNFSKSIGSLKPLHPPLATNSLYIIISKSIKAAPRIIDDFNQGLNTIKSDGTFDKILKKHGF